MTHFELPQNEREILTAERAEQLLESLSAGIKSVKLSGKSFGDGSAAVAADALRRTSETLTRLDVADIIASRPEEEAKRALATIAGGLEDCKHLEMIDLSDNALGAKGIRAVEGLLSSQRELKDLKLCNNGLAADAGELITQALTSETPTALRVLHFHNNLLEDAGCVALVPIVENSPHLMDFRFSSLRLGKKGAVKISTSLAPSISTTLKNLNLSDNTFGEEGSTALANALKDAPLLETLVLRDDALGDSGVKAICDVLVESAPKLIVLDLSGNDMARKGASSLSNLLKIGKLKEVFAEDNELENAGAVELAKGITEDSSLQVLDVSSSEVGGRGAVALANALKDVDGLRRVGMNGNSIPGEQVALIQEMLGTKLGEMDENDDEAEDEDDEEDDEDGEEN